MKKNTVISLAVVLALASCTKNATDEDSAFSFITNPFTRVAEIGGGLQEFGFSTPDEWTISWTPVDWVTIDESQFIGNAAKHLGEYDVIQMTVAPLRKNENREVKFVVHAGGEEHIMSIIQAKPTLPKEQLKFEVKNKRSDKGDYQFEVDTKYEITVKADSPWIHINEVDYEENVVYFDLDAIPDDVASRNGRIDVFLSDGYRLGSAAVEQNM